MEGARRDESVTAERRLEELRRPLTARRDRSDAHAAKRTARVAVRVVDVRGLYAQHLMEPDTSSLNDKMTRCRVPV